MLKLHFVAVLLICHAVFALNVKEKVQLAKWKAKEKYAERKAILK